MKTCEVRHRLFGDIGEYTLYICFSTERGHRTTRVGEDKVQNSLARILDFDPIPQMKGCVCHNALRVLRRSSGCRVSGSPGSRRTWMRSITPIIASTWCRMLRIWF